MGQVISLIEFLETKRELQKWNGVLSRIITLEIFEEVEGSRSFGRILEIFPGNDREEPIGIIKNISPKITKGLYLFTISHQNNKKVSGFLPAVNNKPVEIIIY